MTRFLLIVLMLLTLSACGFHLRGTTFHDTGLNNVGIMLEKCSHEWEYLLKELLRNGRVNVVTDSRDIEYWIILRNEYTESNIVSISSSTSSRQYELVYHVEFSLQTVNSVPLIALTPIVVTRPLTINSDRILGSHDEEEQLKHAMRRDAAMQLLYRISSWHQQHRATHQPLSKAQP